MLLIRKYRLDNNLTQEQLAAKLGVAKTTISMWESGDRKPDIFMLKKIANLFGITTDELLGIN